ncbi:MAG TPA: methionine adenosyltransferase [Acidimicrobiia bacterium]|nr:methionine adenosyltransferase [Acidimicrobiia bacterium]
MLFSSESVTEGHPDKLADQISDSVLDAILEQDRFGRVACETLLTTGLVVVAGEISTNAYVDIASVARQVIKEAGYDSDESGFDGNACGVMVAIDEQSNEIAEGVSKKNESSDTNEVVKLDPEKIGAGDQGLMFGFACDETPDLMPMPIWWAHRITKELANLRKSGELSYLRPDGKAMVTIDYENGIAVSAPSVVVSTQTEPGVESEKLETDVIERVIKATAPQGFDLTDTKYFINPSGSFVLGGPRADAGLTGRKIIVDTYGGFARHGGGAFSGKDATKVDRSAAYAARAVAKSIVKAGLASRCEIQVAYAIGVVDPVSLNIETFGTNQVDENEITRAINSIFDLRPGAIINDFDLLKPRYRPTATYGHFGRTESTFTWEHVDSYVSELKRHFSLT